MERFAEQTERSGRRRAPIPFAALMRLVMPPRSSPCEASLRWPAWLRQCVSVAVVIYLAGLLLTILANSDAGTSRLVRTLKARLFSPWLVPAWLDLGFAQPLTYGEPDDAHQRIEIVPHGRAANATSVVVLPGDLRGERATRWRRLARAIASDKTTAEDAADLAAAVAAWSFPRLGCTDVDMRVLRSGRAEPTAPTSTPDDETAFEARIRRVDGDLQLLKKEPRGEVAPLVPGPGATP